MSDVKCAREEAADADAVAPVLVALALALEDEDEDEVVVAFEGAESALRLFSASGRCVWTPAMTARR